MVDASECQADPHQDGSSGTCIWGWEEIGSSDLLEVLVSHPKKIKANIKTNVSDN